MKYSCTVSNANGYTITEHATTTEAVENALEIITRYVEKGYTFDVPRGNYLTAILEYVGQQTTFPYNTLCIRVEKQG